MKGDWSVEQESEMERNISLIFLRCVSAFPAIYDFPTHQQEEKDNLPT